MVTPTGTTLVENLTLKIEPGSNLLITGKTAFSISEIVTVLVICGYPSILFWFPYVPTDMVTLGHK